MTGECSTSGGDGVKATCFVNSPWVNMVGKSFTASPPNLVDNFTLYITREGTVGQLTLWQTSRGPQRSPSQKGPKV